MCAFRRAILTIGLQKMELHIHMYKQKNKGEEKNQSHDSGSRESQEGAIWCHPKL